MKITKYYIDHARYRAEDELGNIIWVDVNYWNNSYKVSKPNKKLELYAEDLLKRKHRVNFADKMLK